MNLAPVLQAYGLDGQPALTPFGAGLINSTWKVEQGSNAYILQRINHFVFKEPYLIAQNIRKMAAYLAEHHPDYLFVAPLPTINEDDMVVTPEGYFRLFPFVSQSHTIDVVQHPQQAYEAAVQFGRFTRLLSGLAVSELHPTIPRFHDLSLRYDQFLAALKTASPERLSAAQNIIADVLRYEAIVRQYKAILNNPAFPLRVMHHDTKISNVLFDAQDKALCVIDLDTVMPGYFISDLGDMMRTYLSPVSEEETDLQQIEVRDAFFQAIEEGYVSEMGPVLTDAERSSFVFAGKCMIYMQALRFLADFLNNDVYYGARYPDHNLNRACNQMVLLQKLAGKKG